MGNSFAWEIPGFAFSLPANIDMSSEGSYLFTPVNVVAASGVGIDTDSACAPVAASGDAAIGILQNNPQLAEAGSIMVSGISKALLGGTVSIGQLLMATPVGGLQVATSGKFAIAQALQAGVTGQYIAVLLVHNGKI